MRIHILLALVMLFAGCFQQPAPQNETTEKKVEDLEKKVDGLEKDLNKVEDKLQDMEEKLNATNETAPPALPAPKYEIARFNVTITNVHKSYSLSPGIIVVHKKLASLNYLGKTIPASLEPLAEYGDPAPYSSYIKNQSGISAVYPLSSLGPNQSVSYIIEVEKDRPRETQISVMAMIVQSNDGFALGDAITLFMENDVPIGTVTKAQNYDAGTEENSPPGSGYAGGQPELGKDNVDNGVPTIPQRPVILHPQFPETVMRVTIVPQ